VIIKRNYSALILLCFFFGGMKLSICVRKQTCMLLFCLHTFWPKSTVYFHANQQMKTQFKEDKTYPCHSYCIFWPCAMIIVQITKRESGVKREEQILPMKLWMVEQQRGAQRWRYSFWITFDRSVQNTINTPMLD